MNHQACDVTSEELLAFAEEDLPEQRMQQLESHVPICPICQDRQAQSGLIGQTLRDTMPQPDERARHDLLVRLYQEAGETATPRWDWMPAASITAICGVFLLSLVLLWSGIDQFVDTVRSPFQSAGTDQSIEWSTNGDDAEEAFRHVPLPSALSDDFPMYDWSIRSGIRVIIFQTGSDARMSIEVSQFFVDAPSSPEYLAELDTIDGVTVYADDDSEIQELRWTDDGVAHHLRFQALDGSPQDHLTPDDAREIVRVFFE